MRNVGREREEWVSTVRETHVERKGVSLVSTVRETRFTLNGVKREPGT